MSLSPAPGGKEVYYSLMLDRLAEQMRTVEALDNKIAAVFGFSAVTAGLFAGLLTTSNLGLSPVTLSFIALVGLGYALAGFFNYWAYQVSAWSERPNWDDLRNYSGAYPEDAIREWVADECFESLKFNQPKLETKAKRLWWAVTFTALQALGMLGAGAAAVAS